MGKKQKYYVVWEGQQPGIYRSWPEAQAQIEGWKGARFKSFTSLNEATVAFRKGSDDNLEAVATLLLQAREKGREARRRAAASPAPKAPAQKITTPPAWQSNPLVDKNAIAVDASCLGNPGVMEYRGVDLSTGREIFRVGPFQDATNNIGEFLALVHVLALCKQQGSDRPVYSDSRTALSWLRRRGSRSMLKATPRNTVALRLLARADAWVKANTWPNRVMKWDTDHWGEIPADFGRK